MAFNASTFRVMIASPSDMSEERQAATEAIDDWNCQHAVAESVVLLPAKWETHAVPQSGMRPQEVINDQLVRECDILVGLFWTKLGTSTGAADSGTVEEVNQFVLAGKPTLLYFSSRPIDPNKIDLKQHKMLRIFKKTTCEKALVGSFSRVEELRQALARDLTAQVRRLKTRMSLRRSKKLDEAAAITDLILIHQRHNITPKVFKNYRDQFLERKQRLGALRTDRYHPE